MPLGTQAAGIAIPFEREERVAEPIVTTDIASAILVDTASGKILYAHEPAKTWTAASLTKLMTSHVFTTTPTKWEGNAAILKADEVGGGRLQVSSGSVMTFRDILYSALIGSANNAAEALGRLFAPKAGKSAFIALMNQEAANLGLVQSSYHDASGMNEKNTLSAYDTAVLIAETAEDPEAAKAMSLATYTFAIKKPVVKKTIKSTNDLLFSQKDLVITAGKTGFINEAKYNFVVRAYPKGEPEKELVAVVLGADVRKTSIDDSLMLMRWAWSGFDWKASTSTVSLPKNRSLGDKGEDVKDLQKYLNTHGFLIAASGPGSPGKETALFGALTKAALIRYQEAHADAILTPHKAVKGSGYLDYYTRFAMHSGM
ncbi:MAG: peptidoglycan-binding protein [Candidatus Uhrbacteria bacterium]|nr:peptidoglycan-binding protein [Candidatus Uhrbacteria bacterium]